MAFVNTMEEIVRTRINNLIEGTDCCTCKKCLDDMTCLALNALPSKYASTQKGVLFSKISIAFKQNNIDIDVACMNAINCVKNNPKHDNIE